MKAFQIMWSKPAQARGHQFTLNDYDILLTILSVLKWQQLNGTIKLYADKRAADLYDKLGILGIWNEYDKTFLLDKINDSIDPTIFWAAGKFFAYLNEPVPCVTLDTDMIVWKKLDGFFEDVDLRFTHWEEIRDPWYCPKSLLLKPEGYEFRQSWNEYWTRRTPAMNAGILYFNNGKLKNDYAHAALDFMRNNGLGQYTSQGVTPELLFAEQRLLAMCVKEGNYTAKPFLDATLDPQTSPTRFIEHDKEYGEWEFANPNNGQLLTHAWLYKVDLKADKELRHQYCKILIKKITSEFKKIEIVSKNEDIYDFLNQIKPLKAEYGAYMRPNYKWPEKLLLKPSKSAYYTLR